jgi:hypothetical protein
MIFVLTEKKDDSQTKLSNVALPGKTGCAGINVGGRSSKLRYSICPLAIPICCLLVITKTMARGKNSNKTIKKDGNHRRETKEEKALRLKSQLEAREVRRIDPVSSSYFLKT